MREQDARARETREREVPERETREADMPERETREADMPEERARERDASAPEAREQDAREQDVPERDVPERGLPGLTAAERRVCEAFGRGEETDFRTGDPERDDPAGSAGWGPDRTVRGEVLARLLLGGAEAPAPGRVPALRLGGALIEGGLDLDYAEIAYRVTLKGCHVTGPITLNHARTRQLALRGCRLARLSVASASIDGNVRLTGTRITGPLRLDGAHIAGVLQLDGVRLSSPDGDDRPVLAADRLQVDDHIWMRSGFTADGEVVLRGAQIGGDLDLTGAHISHPRGGALTAPRMRVEGEAIFDRVRTTGEVRLGGTSVAGSVRFGGARLSNPGGTVLHAYHLEVGASLRLSAGFEADGRVALLGARINDMLSFRNARLIAPGAVAVSMWRTQARETDLRTAVAPEGRVDLRHAALGVIQDDPATWPADLLLDGLGYERFETPLPAAQRLRWLRRDRSGYASQPFEQLALAYRSLGHEHEARTVLLAKERVRHRALPWYARLWGAVQDVTVGYGYRPIRAGAWLLGLLALGSAVFTARPAIPDKDAGPVDFSPVIFTLDHLLPVVGFGQGAAFTPTPGTQWVGYVLTAAGWILATTIATGITRSVNRA
jgi:hypothetical protein